MYHYTKNEVSTSRHSKVIARMDRQTHTDIQTVWKHNLPAHAGGSKKLLNIKKEDTLSAQLIKTQSVNIFISHYLLLGLI